MHYSGADLNAILTTARLSAVRAFKPIFAFRLLSTHSVCCDGQIHDTLERLKHEITDGKHAPATAPGSAAATDQKHAPKHSAPLVTRAHLEAAFTASHPSVPEKERLKFDRIYSRFISARQDKGPATDFDPKAKLRTSFA